MSDMVRAWLDHTQQLDQAATGGPWYTFKTAVGLTNGIGSKVIPKYEAVIEDTYTDPADAEWIAHARSALPAATAALRAVLDLHQPYQYRASERDLCAECINDAETEGTIQWPCPTVRAITDALTSHQHPTPVGSSGK